MTGQEILNETVNDMVVRFKQFIEEGPNNYGMTDGQLRALLALGLKTIHFEDMMVSIQEHAYWMISKVPTD